MFWFFDGEACGILAPQTGIEPTPSALEGEALTTGLPEKSQERGHLLTKRDFPPRIDSPDPALMGRSPKTP